MILLALGIIIGLLLATIWILLSVKILPEPRELPAAIQTTFKKKPAEPTGAIINAPSDAVYAFQRKIDTATEDLRLDDLIS